jgi:glycosyltransferase involved in cell wall biosynthesis
MSLRRTRRALAGNRDTIRLVFLTPTLAPGGAERQQLLLAEHLPRPQFDVRFVCLLERGAWAPRAEALGASVEVLGLSRPTGVHPGWVIDGLRASRQYRRLVADVDIVDAWLAPSFTYAALHQPLARVPVLIAGRRSMSHLYERKSSIRRALTAWAARRAAAVVANSRAAAHEVIERDRVPPDRVVVIPNAVVPLQVDPDAVARQRAAWGFGAGEVVVGSVANYKPGKGLETLIEAAARLRADAPNLRYVLVGEGPTRDALAAAIARLDLGSVVVLAGRVDDARLLYPAFDIAVQTSTSEGLPNAVLEASAAGLPIIATAVGGTAEIIDTSERGLLIRPEDPGELARALLRLARDEPLRQELGRAAFERSADFSTDRLVAATAELYVRLLRERRSPG